MTTQQQVDKLTAAVGHLEELAGKIKEALGADDPAEAEVMLGELAESLAAMAGAVGELAADSTAPAVPHHPETPEPPAD